MWLDTAAHLRAFHFARLHMHAAGEAIFDSAVDMEDVSTGHHFWFARDVSKALKSTSLSQQPLICAGRLMWRKESVVCVCAQLLAMRLGPPVFGKGVMLLAPAQVCAMTPLASHCVQERFRHSGITR